MAYPKHMLTADARCWARQHGYSPDAASTFAAWYIASYGHLSVSGMRPTFAEAGTIFAAEGTTDRPTN